MKKNSIILPLITSLIVGTITFLLLVALLIFIGPSIGYNYPSDDGFLLGIIFLISIPFVIYGTGLALTIVAMVKDTKELNVLNLIAAILFFILSLLTFMYWILSIATLICFVLMTIHYIKSIIFYNKRNIAEKVADNITIDEFKEFDN